MFIIEFDGDDRWFLLYPTKNAANKVAARYRLEYPGYTYRVIPAPPHRLEGREIDVK